MSLEINRKRSIMDDSVDTPLAKRTKDDSTEATTLVSSCPKSGTSQFQCFHLLLLQSLYDTEDCIPLGSADDDSLGNVSDDGDYDEMTDDTVDDRLWNKARKFVKDREDLLKLKKEASRVNGVHQEALDYLEEHGQGRGSSTAPSTPSGGKPTGSSWQPSADDSVPHRFGKHPSISSPNCLKFFSPQRPTTSSQSPNNCQTPAQCFALVAHLLKSKCEEFNGSVKNRSNIYGPMLQEVEEKIDVLQGKLRILKESTLSKQKRKVEDLLSRALLSSSMDNTDPAVASVQFGNFVSKLETKLQLWSILAADLKDVVPLVCPLSPGASLD